VQVQVLPSDTCLAADWDIPTIIKNCEAATFEGVELRTTHAHKVEVNLSKEYILLAEDVGATGVKVRPNGLPKDLPVEKTLKQIGRSLGEMGGFARDHGQVIRLEAS
jgi:hypothetical protein